MFLSLSQITSHPSFRTSSINPVFVLHCINKMLRSCNLLRQNVLNFGIKRIDVVFKRTLANIAFHCIKNFILNALILRLNWVIKKYILTLNTKVKRLSPIASLLFSLCKQSTSVVELPFYEQWWFHQISIYTTKWCLLSISGQIVIEIKVFHFNLPTCF